MAKENLEKERAFMDFIEGCADCAFPDVSASSVYFEKSLFLRICAGQQILKRLFFSGHEERLLHISHYGPQRFFSELVA